MVKDFKAFLLKHGVIGLAVGVIIGGAVGKLVNSIVADLVMPLVGALSPSGDWRQIKMGYGSLQFGVGNFAGNFLDFLIVSFVVFLIVKTIIKEDPKK